MTDLAQKIAAIEDFIFLMKGEKKDYSDLEYYYSMKHKQR